MIEGDLSSSRNLGRSAGQALARVPSLPSLDVEVFMWTRDRIVKVVVALLGVFTCTASALAKRGDVLPPDAQPKGYSLSEIAVATAYYNTGTVFGLVLPPPKVPFEVIEGDTTVKPGTKFYLPIFFDDDSGGAAPGFPTDLDDEDAIADFLYETAGVEAFVVQVDDKITVLDDDSVTGVNTTPLPDGTPAGTHYIVAAAFLGPLEPGKHTVGFGGVIADKPVVFVSYDITVTDRGDR
jgi:hypothetical protein